MDFVEAEGVFREYPPISDSLYANSRTLDIGKGCCPVLWPPVFFLGTVFLDDSLHYQHGYGAGYKKEEGEYKYALGIHGLL